MLDLIDEAKRVPECHERHKAYQQLPVAAAPAAACSRPSAAPAGPRPFPVRSCPESSSVTVASSVGLINHASVIRGSRTSDAYRDDRRRRSPKGFTPFPSASLVLTLTLRKMRRMHACAGNSCALRRVSRDAVARPIARAPSVPCEDPCPGLRRDLPSLPSPHSNPPCACHKSTHAFLRRTIIATALVSSQRPAGSRQDDDKGMRVRSSTLGSGFPTYGQRRKRCSCPSRRGWT